MVLHVVEKCVKVDLGVFCFVKKKKKSWLREDFVDFVDDLILHLLKLFSIYLLYKCIYHIICGSKSNHDFVQVHISFVDQVHI